MSNMKLEELNRRRASFNILQETQDNTRHNSLRVAVKQRRASVISINPDNLLEVAAGPTRTGSFRSSSNDNLLMVSSELSTAIVLHFIYWEL